MATRRYHEPRQRGRSPLDSAVASGEPRMIAVYVIGIFILVVFALNVVDFGRID